EVGRELLAQADRFLALGLRAAYVVGPGVDHPALAEVAARLGAPLWESLGLTEYRPGAAPPAGRRAWPARPAQARPEAGAPWGAGRGGGAARGLAGPARPGAAARVGQVGGAAGGRFRPAGLSLAPLVRRGTRVRPTPRGAVCHNYPRAPRSTRNPPSPTPKPA